MFFYYYVPDGEDEGWIYKKSKQGQYRIHALFLSDFEYPFWSRKQLLAFHSKESVHEYYDSPDRPEHSARVSPKQAETIIKRWKKLAKNFGGE